MVSPGDYFKGDYHHNYIVNPFIQNQMKEQISKHLSKNYQHWMLGFMLITIFGELYLDRASKDFVKTLFNNLILLIWVLNWYMMVLFSNRSKKHLQEEADLWRDECFRLYKLIEDHNNKVSKK